MSESESFLDCVMADKVSIGDIDAFVEEWHEGESLEELHEYLGMTSEEYALWLEHPDMLATICEVRQGRRSLVEAVNRDVLELRITGRPGNGEKLKRLEIWLRQRGVFA